MFRYRCLENVGMPTLLLAVPTLPLPSGFLVPGTMWGVPRCVSGMSALVTSRIAEPQENTKNRDWEEERIERLLKEAKSWRRDASLGAAQSSVPRSR